MVWIAEAIVMAAVLILVIAFSGNVGNPVEWIGTAAVFVMTRRVAVATRMSETLSDVPDVGWSARYTWYLVAGEILWTAYFVMLGAWSALVGVGLMLAYPVWRKWYRSLTRDVIGDTI